MILNSDKSDEELVVQWARNLESGATQNILCGNFCNVFYRILAFFLFHLEVRNGDVF